jgi:hypothetical protein
MAVEQALFGPAWDFAEEMRWSSIAIDRYATFQGRRADGSYQCPKCWICNGQDSEAFGPTGAHENGKEVYLCRCDFKFLY